MDCTKQLLIGEARGIAIGETKGELEGKLKVAKNLKGMGLALDAIQKATGLNAEEIANCLISGQALNLWGQTLRSSRQGYRTNEV